jgi:alpha-tubulin suppressor-like RCC1 family protein
VATSLAFKDLSAGAYHTCGIDTTGKAWCWGYDHQGQLGDGNDGQANDFTPVPVATSLVFTSLMAGGFHTCGIDTTGKAWCWGYDFSGQLGDGDDGQAEEYGPVPVAGSLTFRALTAGSSHTCGLDPTGKAWCWGGDHYGQLGDGNDGQASEYAPAAVASGLPFTTLSAGDYHICGVTTSSKASCWGYDAYGQVGDGDDGQADEYAPVPVAGDHTFATTW